jgi:hypothetical protein
MISHDDVCRLSRIFGQVSDLRTWQDQRINEWLKEQTALALARGDARKCTCPVDEAPEPCQQKFALKDCIAASLLRQPEAAPGWPEELLEGLREQILDRRGAKKQLRGSHLDWMLIQIKNGAVIGAKAHRWFAFVQGVLAERGALDVDLERDRTRPFFKAMLTAAPAPSAGVFRHGNEEKIDHDLLIDVATIINAHFLKSFGTDRVAAVRRAAQALIFRATPPTPSADTRDAGLEEAAKVAKDYAAKMSELQNQNSSGVTHPEGWAARIMVAKYIAVLIEAARSTPAPANGEKRR